MVNDEPRDWWPDLALLTGVAVLTAALAMGALLDIGIAIRDWSDSHHPGLLHALSRGLNQMGSANLLATIALVLAVPLAVRSRSARPLLPIVTTYVVSHVLIAPIKIFTDRAAPHAPAPDAVELFADPDGWSYPSGHVANTLIWYLLLVLLADALLRSFGRPPLPGRLRRTLLVAPPIIVTATVTYLGFHWLTDSIAALLLGWLLARLLRRMPWAAEQTYPNPPHPRTPTPASPRPQREARELDRGRLAPPEGR